MPQLMPLNRLGAVSVAESLNFTPKQIGAGAVDCGLVDLVSRIAVTAKPSRHVPDGGSAHMDIVPDTGQLSQVMVQATAPAFILGAVAGFISILLGRMTSVIDRIRSLNEIADSDTTRAHLKSDIPRLRKRAKLLNSATHLALVSGMCTSLLLVVGFGSAFFRLQHVYGAGILFAVAVALLGGSLFRFSQEVRIGLSEGDHFR